jgi:hypothetical protein
MSCDETKFSRLCNTLSMSLLMMEFLQKKSSMSA